MKVQGSDANPDCTVFLAHMPNTSSDGRNADASYPRPFITRDWFARLETGLVESKLWAGLDKLVGAQSVDIGVCTDLSKIEFNNRGI